jgi:hypothetical protein
MSTAVMPPVTASPMQPAVISDSGGCSVQRRGWWRWTVDLGEGPQRLQCLAAGAGGMWWSSLMAAGVVRAE